jgi:hypothetical protein
MSEQKNENEIEKELEMQREAANTLFGNYRDALSSINDGYPVHWDQLPEELKTKSEELISSLLLVGQKVALACRNSLLINDADVQEVPILIRKMIRSIELANYIYRPPRPVYHEGGFVVGSQPADHEDVIVYSVSEAKDIYLDAHERLLSICRLTDATASSQKGNSVRTEIANRYHPNSAFIMMWMDKEQPELIDVRDVVRETFDKFGIRAVRADDIEHEGVITQRILDEIRTSEFLFADLTGARPSVYYEVGYAHALGKRVILFRKKGTDLHFDLAGYNCPEYENLHDLREKLTRRLENVTNKKSSNH